jgi:A/G-specific adenine glycosylase
MNQHQIEFLRNKLIKWYDKNARVLPWRNHPTPYEVMLSEIMLQQTRVDTVKSYYVNFLEVVPTIFDLAKLPDEQLYKLWQGLGYYSRAKNLKKAAMIIVDEYAGVVPSNKEDLLKLPGIGDYSSGSIASIAYGKKYSAVDGNVLRVIARITSNQGDIASPNVKREIQQLVEEILPMDRVGDFNQSLMELGATICLPNGAPKCEECPLNSICLAKEKGLIDSIPLKTKKKARTIEKKTVFMIETKNSICLSQRSETGLLFNLWELPNTFGYLNLNEVKKYLENNQITEYEVNQLEPSRHIFSHIEWDMIGYRVRLNEQKPIENMVWASEIELKSRYSVPTAFQKFVKQWNKSK